MKSLKFSLGSVHLWIIFLSVAVFSAGAMAQPRAEKLGPIQKIVIRGTKRIEQDAVIAKLKSKVGEQAVRGRIADDIRAVHALGFFDDVRVDYEDATLIVTVKERPTIVKIRFEGNDQISSDDLKEVIKLKDYSILDINRVSEDITLIQKYYEEKGFYLARVSHYTKPTDKDGEIELIYRIGDFDKVRIKKITFLNNSVFGDDILKKILRNTKEGYFFSWLSGSGTFKESAFKQDMQILTFFYLDKGYVKFRYEKPVVTISEDKKWLFISIYIEEGDKYDVGEVEFGGDLLFPKEELHEKITLKKGEVFSISKRNLDIQSLTEKYQDLGYAFVNTIPKMNIHDDTKIVDIRYDFEKGNLVHFGEINIIGNTKTRDKVIRREMRVREGELFNGTRLRVSRERVERLGYFAPGEVVFNQLTRKDNKDVVDLEVQVKERSTGTVTLGMGYGSLQKFFLTAQISEINLFGRGQSISLSGQWASDRRSRSLSLSFTEPYTLDTEWSSGFDLFFVSFPIPRRYLAFKNGFDLRFGHPLVDDVNTFFTYKFEHMHLEIDTIQAALDDAYRLNPQFNADPDRGNLSSLGLSVVRDKRNNRYETTAGDYESLSTEFAGLGGNKDFFKLVSEGRFYHPFSDSLTFRTKLEVGHIFPTTAKRVPPAEMFYLGGPNNLKGFETFSVSPKTAAGTPLGGTTELLYIAEFEMPLIREAGLKMVVFYDMGNSFPGLDDFIGLVGLKKDVGFGFRWFSPIGPLRFEWGFPLGRKSDESDVNFNFFIGPPF